MIFVAKYLVTGGAGFIGSHLVDKLIESGNEVVVLDNLSTGLRSNVHQDAELIVGDVRDDTLLEVLMPGMSGCFHLAAVASVQACQEQWAESHATNLTGSINVYAACVHAGNVPVVYASSAAVYGEVGQTAIHEDCPKQPLTAYGADKLGCEQHAYTAYLNHGLANTGLRFFNVYGPRQNPKSPYSGVISKFIDNALCDEPITIFGDGEQSRDFIYVGDVVNHLITAMKKVDGAHVLNVCTGESTNINELANLLTHLIKTHTEIRYQPARDGDIKFSLGDNSLAKAELQLSKETDLNQGLNKTIDSLRDS